MCTHYQIHGETVKLWYRHTPVGGIYIYKDKIMQNGIA